MHDLEQAQQAQMDELVALYRRVAELEVAEMARRQAEKLLRVQHDLGIALGSISDLNEAMSRVMDAALQIEGVDCGGIYLIDALTGRANLIAHRGLSPQFIARAAHYPADSPHVRLVLAGKPYYGRYADVLQVLEESTTGFADCERRALRAFAIVPICHQSQVMAVLNLASRTIDHFPPATCTAIEATTAQIGESLTRIVAEARLRESEERYRTLVENIPIGIYRNTPGPQGRFLMANPAFFRMFGLASEQELHEITVADLYLYSHERQLFSEKLLAQGRVAGVEMQLKKKDGTLLWGRVTAQVVYDTDGQVAYFDCAIEDITEHKRDEERLRVQAMLLDHIQDRIVATDLEGRITFVNKANVQMIERSPEELIGQMVHILGEDPTLGATQQEIIEKTLQNGFWQGVVVNYTSHGDRRIMDARTWVIRDPEDRPTGMVGIATDVTEHWQDEKEKQRLHAQLVQAQKMEAVGQLAGGVAHDFNNHITAILGYSDLLLDELSEQDPRRADVEEIKKAAARSAALTRQLLAFSRKQVIQPIVLNLNTLVTEMSKMLQRLIGEDIELIIILAPDLGQVMADAGQIEQVILNLAVNARDAMSAGRQPGGTLTIETANVVLDETYVAHHLGAVAGTFVMLAVSDSGIGMDREVQSHLFEPFFTTKEKGQGTGLGLATVYGIVKQSGGNIWVYSEPGHGATFRVYLPRIDEATAALPDVMPKRVFTQGSETVLLVEDESAVRAIARRALQRQGYVILEAGNAEEALVLCERYKGPIHLLLTDVVMPGKIGGRALADRLIGLRPHTQVLFMSGYTDDAIVHRGVLESGINFISKPFTSESIIRKVRDVLDQAKDVPVE